MPANRAADDTLTPPFDFLLMRWRPGLPGGFEAGLIAISITAVDMVVVAEPGQRRVPGRIRTS